MEQVEVPRVVRRPQQPLQERPVAGAAGEVVREPGQIRRVGHWSGRIRVLCVGKGSEEEEGDEGDSGGE